MSSFYVNNSNHSATDAPNIHAYTKNIITGFISLTWKQNRHVGCMVIIFIKLQNGISAEVITNKFEPVFDSSYSWIKKEQKGAYVIHLLRDFAHGPDHLPKKLILT